MIVRWNKFTKRGASVLLTKNEGSNSTNKMNQYDHRSMLLHIYASTPLLLSSHTLAGSWKASISQGLQGYLYMEESVFMITSFYLFYEKLKTLFSHCSLFSYKKDGGIYSCEIYHTYKWDSTFIELLQYTARTVYSFSAW